MKRIKVPRIPAKGSIDLFEKTIIKRNYPVGKENFLRCYSGDPVRLELELFPHTPHDLTFMLYTNLGKHFKGYYDIPFVRDGNTAFVDIDTSKAGIAKFTLKIIDNKNHEYLDTLYDGYLLIDPSEMKNLKLYTLIPTRSGHIGDWIAMIPHIKSMGFNAIHLLPITEMGTSQSPYSAKSLTRIDPSYAIPDDTRPLFIQFEDFITAAHAQELRICLDYVLNHIANESEFYEKRSDWLYTDPTSPDGFRRAGCWHGNEWIYWNDLRLINYEISHERSRNELWDYMTKVALFWLRYADMIRLDNLHSSQFTFIKYIIRKMKMKKPNLIVFGELFTDHFDIQNKVIDLGLNLILATTWGCKFVPELADYFRYIHACTPKIKYMTPPTSHDSGSPLQEFCDEHYAELRYFANLFFGVGFTGMVQGYELGLKEKLNFIGTRGQDKLDFNVRPHDSVSFIGSLNTVHECIDVLQKGTTTIINTSSILGALKCLDEQRMLVLANFDIHEKETIEVELNGPVCEGRDVLSKDIIALTAGKNIISLEPAQCALFLLQ